MKQFILDTLLPYKNDSSLCGFDKERNHCKYIDVNGNKCAVGKHLRNVEDYRNNNANVRNLGNLKEILTKEAYEMIPNVDIWYHMQKYHDRVAQGMGKLSCNSALSELEHLTGLDLTELKF